VPLSRPATSCTERSCAEGRVAHDPPPSPQQRIAPWKVPCDTGAGSGDGWEASRAGYSGSRAARCWVPARRSVRSRLRPRPHRHPPSKNETTTARSARASDVPRGCRSPPPRFGNRLATAHRRCARGFEHRATGRRRPPSRQKFPTASGKRRAAAGREQEQPGQAPGAGPPGARPRPAARCSLVVVARHGAMVPSAPPAVSNLTGPYPPSLHGERPVERATLLVDSHPLHSRGVGLPEV